ncbi:MAG: hypothetical protein JWN00_6065, partial [Actinomycetia bacterium]|nr:hypothetical protein [Actinomycetes bacterium]
MSSTGSPTSRMRHHRDAVSCCGTAGACPQRQARVAIMSAVGYLFASCANRNDE